MRAWLVWSLLTTWTVTCLACGETPPTRVERNGLVGRRAQARERPALTGGRATQPGDFVLESATLRVLVGGSGRRSSERGAVLEVRLLNTVADQSLSDWSFGLNVQDRGVPLALSDLRLVERHQRPVLRILTVGKLGSREVHVDRELSLSRVDGVLNVATAVWTDDGAPIESARVVERLDWEGATPFAPGVGEIADETFHRVPWLARDGKTSAVLFGYVPGVMHVRTSFQPHGSERLPGSTVALSPVGTVIAGTPLRLRAVVALAHYGVSDAVRRFGWARGKPFAEATVHVPYQPPGTLVRVYDAAGAVQLRGRPRPDGGLVVPLPDVPDVAAGEARAKLTIAATAWGHAATTPIRVVAGQSLVLRIPRGGSVHVVVRDKDGRNMPGRIRFESLDNPKKKIDLGPDHNATGARDAVITVDGDVEVPLMPGRFLVRVSRGPEYDVFEQTVDVTESFQPQVGARLERVIDPGPWVGADFHLHSAPSFDSEVTLEDRVASLVAEGVRFAVPTDHDHVTSLIDAIRVLGVKDFGTVAGVEVSTAEPVIGHFNAYPYPLDPTQPGNGAPSHRGLTAVEIFTQLHATPTDPLVQVNHPRMEGAIGYFDAYAYEPSTGQASAGFSEAYDVLEVWNGFDLARPAVYERVFREWLAILARGQRVVATGNSDSHSVRYQWAGYPRTWIHASAGPSAPDAVIAALRAGRAFVSDGPFLEVTIDDRGPGEMVSAREGKVSVRVHVRAAPWVDVTTLECWVGTELVRSEPIVVVAAKANRRDKSPARLPVLRLLKEFDVVIAKDSFVVVRVRGDQPMDAYFGRAAILPSAFINPIFVDADGDGRVPWLTPVADATDRDAGGRGIPDARIPTHAHDDQPHDGHVHAH